MKNFILALLCAISFVSAYAKTNENQLFLQVLFDRAKESVALNDDITSKGEVINLLKALEADGKVSEWGSDDLRIKFVHAQAVIEQILSGSFALGEIKELVGVIHTPMPATPFCTEVENLDVQLLDRSIRDNHEKLLTVRNRAVILRDYLEKGGRLYIAYPKGGFEKRTTVQQAIFKKELAKYAGRLIDSELACLQMNQDKIGATYFFTNESGDLFALSIKARQSNDPSEYSEWALWLGPIKHSVIKKRAFEILNYLYQNNGPDLRQDLKI